MIFEKGPDGRLKRIEYRGKYLRASRTGGVALRAQAKAGGINLTANTNRGARVSTRIAKGTQAAFQNGRFVLRGRYGDGPNKVNLSKSGVSVSTKTDIGTVNWFNGELMTACLASSYQEVTGTDAAIDHFLSIDERLSKHQGRTQLQDRLFAAYAGACEIEVEAIDS